MSTAKVPQILVVVGDHDLALQVQQALQGERIAVQRAFSHRDGLYAFTHGKFDLVLVDAAMLDRRSGEVTLATLTKQKNRAPVIALATSDTLSDQARPLATAVINRLDKLIILHTVLDALHMTAASPNGAQTTPLGSANEALSRRIDEIQILFALGKSLTEVLDLTEVLNRVVEAARRLTNADEGLILLPDEEGDDLYLRAKVGIDVEVARNFRVKTQDNLVGEVFKSGRPILVGNQGPQKVKTEYFVNSLLYVPILLKGKTIGVLGVNNKDKQDKFDTNHQELLMNLASYAAIAIENARIHEESLERARELESLVQASQVVNSTLSLQETLPNICEQLAQALNVNRSEIYQWDREKNQLYSLARFYRAVWRYAQAPLLELKQQPSLKLALDNGRVLWVARGDKSLPEESRALEQTGAAALLVIPVRLDNQVFGAIRAFYIQAPDHLPQLDAMTRAGSFALEALASVINQKTQTRAQNVFRLAENINRLTEASWCQLSVLVNDSTALALHMEVGNGIWLKPPYATLDLTPYPDWVDSIQAQIPLNYQLDNKKLAGGGRVLLETSGSRSILALPLVQRGQTQGLVLFGDTEHNRVFSQREIDLGRALVGQAATALENSHLFRRLELSLQDLRDAQDRLVQTARLSAMGELAAVVAHQINNPLTTIIVDTEMMLMDELPTSRNYQPMEAVVRAGKRAASVAKRLLAIARPNDPDAPTESVDIIDTIKGILSLVKTHIERDQIRILTDLPEDITPSPIVQAVRGRLEDVWLNLLMNAHDALQGRPNAQIGIDLHIFADQKRIEVVVWDNGPGISDDIKGQVFNPFFTTKPVGEGTGLGLHICRQVVERGGGEITVESQPGQGTRFFVRLPITS